MLKMKLHHFGHLMRRANSLEKTLMLGKIEGRRRGWQMMKWLNGIMNSMAMSLSKLRDIVKDRETWHAALHGSQRVTKYLSTEQQLQQQHGWIMLMYGRSQLNIAKQLSYNFKINKSLLQQYEVHCSTNRLRVRKNWASPVAQRLKKKNPPATWELEETWVQSLHWEDPLKGT